MFIRLTKILILLLYIFGASFCKSDQLHNDIKERSLSRQKRLLFYPQFTVLQLSMCLVAQVSYIPSHKVAINSGFQINYALPFNLSNFYASTFFPKSFKFGSFPISTFINKLVESDGSLSVDSNLVPTELPMADFRTENSTTENEVLVDDNEVATTEIETTTNKAKKKRKSKIKRDLTAAEFYAGIKETLNIAGYHEDCLLKSVCELAKHPLAEHDDDIIYELIHFILTPSLHQGFDPRTEEKEQKIFEEAENIGKSGGDCEVFYKKCENSPLDSISNYVTEDMK